MPFFYRSRHFDINDGNTYISYGVYPLIAHFFFSQVDSDDVLVKEKILQKAGKRIPWGNLRGRRTSLMTCQVGGLSEHKKPSLSLGKKYLLKPLRTDHRGLRELVFYETVLSCASNNNYLPYFDSCVLYRHANLPNCLDVICLLFVRFVIRGSAVTSTVQKDVMDVLSIFGKIRQEKKLLSTLNDFMPKYHGIVKCAADATTHFQAVVAPQHGELTAHSYLVLDDVTSNFDIPCIMDIKIGTVSHEPDATPEKMAREGRKYPQQVMFGFRIVGMRVYRPTDGLASADGYVVYDKYFGRSLRTIQDVKQAFVSFFSPGNHSGDGRTSISNSLQLRIIENILSKLKSMLDWFHENNSFHFYASSLLLVYEAGAFRTEGINEAKSDCKLIDFGRVRRSNGHDDGCIKGLVTLIDLLKEIMSQL